jgi:PIN domain nuclease of toxin-antitoxin system
MIHVVDAHALLWFLADDRRLGPAADAVLSNPGSDLVLPATALAEACWIVQRGRIPLTVEQVLAAIDADARVRVVPLDRAVIERGNGLSAIPEMHDRQIVATTLLLQDAGEAVALLTADLTIAASGLVSVVW